MATNNGSAEIVNMDDARARRRASELSAADYETSGAHLKAVREASGLTVEEVSERTHIKADYLGAIEDMQVGRLPSRPFAIGFVKVYAEALGLDPRPVVARFKEEAGYSAPVEVESEKFEAAQRATAEAERPHMSLLAFVAILFFILWCAWQITQPRGETGAVVEVASAAGQGGAAPAGANVVEARLIDAPEPVYPQRCESAAAPLETIEVAFNVTAAGAVSGERIAASTNSCFDAAALNAARRWRFSPRTVDGAPRTAYDQRFTVSFERPLPAAGSGP